MRIYLGSFLAGVLGLSLVEFAKVFVQEKGRQLATRRDIEQILKELEKTTRTAEETKAEVTQAFHRRQQLWDEKKNLYGQLLVDLREAARNYARAMTVGIAPPPKDPEMEERRDKVVQDLIGDGDRFVKKALGQKGLAEVWLPPKAVQILDDLEKELEQASEPRDWFYFLDASSGALTKAYDAMVSTAREDILSERNL